jgi:hypothetical protein
VFVAALLIFPVGVAALFVLALIAKKRAEGSRAAQRDQLSPVESDETDREQASGESRR